MRNNMKELDKLIAIDECKMNSSNRKALTIGKEYEHKGYYNIDLVIIHSDINKNHLFKVNDLSKFFKIKDEWKPTQGDKVLVSDNEIGWNERYYALFFNNKHYVQSKHSESELTNWLYIKPCEDEIKVGDWVKNREVIAKFESFMSKEECAKITNPQLIELLNKEL